jgi:hypothetical protein
MNQNIQPIFIMGAPRSGTTMLASMLAAGDGVLALPEMHYIHDLLKEEMLFGEVSKDDIFERLKKHFMFADLRIANNDNEIKTLVKNNTKETIKYILDEYNKKYVNKKYNYWVEHSPHNYNYYDVMLYHFPNAKFVHILRDGRAVYRSTKETDWGYKDVITGARNWERIVEHCLILGNAHPNNVMRVKYENLTRAPEKYIKLICGFLDIDYQQSMLDANGLRKPQFAKYTKSLGKRAHTKSQAIWKDSLKKYEIKHFTAYNKHLLTYLGYEVDGIRGKEIKGLERIYHKIIGKVKTYYFKRHAKKRVASVFEK